MTPSRLAVLPLLLILLLIPALSPTLAVAQTASTTSDGSDLSGSEVRQRTRDWRRGQSGELEQKVSVLGDTAVMSVFMPVLFGVGVHSISPNFGDPRSGGRTHIGEDIMGVAGTPIVSPTAAVVIRTGVGAGEGNYVSTANPGGETFVYMHLDRFGEGVAQGTVLEQGSLIGYVGNTGNASRGAPHLHFEIHSSGGTAVDPFPRLSGEFTAEQKMSYLSKIFTQTSDITALAQLLVSNFRSTFTVASARGVILPPLITGFLASTLDTPLSTGGGLALTRNLFLGVSGEDVRSLQKFSNAGGYTVASSGAGSVGNETTYFGSATRAAVIKFQIAHNIAPSAGYVGLLTRAALAAG